MSSTEMLPRFQCEEYDIQAFNNYKCLLLRATVNFDKLRMSRIYFRGPTSYFYSNFCIQ